MCPILPKVYFTVQVDDMKYSMCHTMVNVRKHQANGGNRELYLFREYR